MTAALPAVHSWGPFLRSAFLMSVKTVIGLLQINNGKAMADGHKLPRIAASDRSWRLLYSEDLRILVRMNRNGRYIHP